MRSRGTIWFPSAFAAIQLGPQGTIWVQHVQSATSLSDEELEQYNVLEDTGAPEWDVFDSQGRYLGIGTASYVEGTGLGPFEGAGVTVQRDGKVLLVTGAAAQGQEHRTMLAQV